MEEKISGLVQITDSLFQVSQAKMQTIVAEEKRVRLALSDLEKRRTSAEPENEMVAMRTLGADIMWQVWVDRKRGDLQLLLAQILVRKAQATDELRYAFGKNQTAADLATRQALVDKKNRAAKCLAQEQARLVF